MKLLWIENAVPLNTRSERLLKAVLASGAFEVVICAWNRTGAPCREESDPAYRLFATATGEKRLLRKALDLPSFIGFVRRTVEAERPDVIVASFWDSALAAAWATVGRRVPVVYDVLDMPGGGRLLYGIGRFLERIALRRVSATLLASRFYVPFYASPRREHLVLENLPDLGATPDLIPASQQPPRIAYVGSLRFPETLRPLIDTAIARRQSLDFFGGGPDFPSLQAHARAHPHIRFHGPYAYRDLPGIYAAIDLVWAAYPADDLNVRYAISNKYFESLWFGVPAVFSAGTALGDMVAREGTGFVVDATSASAVAALLTTLHEDPAVLAATRRLLLEKRARLQDELSWDSQAHRFVALLQRRSS